MNSEMNSTHFDDAWERVKSVSGWGDYKDLATFVGSTSQSISGVKKRGKFPLEWAYKVAQAFASNTDWIMTGKLDHLSQAANGNGILQGHHVDAEEIHIDVHNHVTKEQHEEYIARDPLDDAFVRDWHRLSEVEMMRFWTLLKEKIELSKED
ncbi:helix-turn-helix domain containing protein [Geobacter pelophilus]|uniref:Helix-turn-helix domain containing protein n=1 Tax=Geoanaerobacter pelophilus TaxID=60036 RepID=A0AAW4L796_9BACT|nr:helix-turn-helix domain-containing protein [Geoanaerobacter pelophilus]MBT0665715.1 helix-turn-helix domain containing protein [Geoanaerobacter pelophilus]